MKIRALVADDQPLARERILALLADEDDVQVVGTAASGPETVQAVATLSPDLVFLDMQMPELDGIGVVEAVGPERMPPTIFVTAYDEYAIQAFEVHALDYLLKPFGRSRFQRALARAREHLKRNQADAIASRLVALVNELRAPPMNRVPSSDRLVVKAGGRVVFLDLDRIDWIEAEGNYVRLHAGSESYLQRDTMANVMARLGDERFFRIHRSRIVRIDLIRELRLAAGGDYDVILKNGLRLGLSRLYKDSLQEKLARGS
jgi:two-component system LytT family response regulator